MCRSCSRKEARAKALRDDHAYWKASGIYNWQQLIYFLGRTYGNIDFPQPNEPAAYDGLGIIAPDSKQFFKSVDTYAEHEAFDASKPVIALFYLAYHSRVSTSGVVAELISKIKPIANVLPIGFTSTMQVNVERLRKLLTHPGKTASLIINCLGFRLGGGPRGHAAPQIVELLEQLGAPILHPFFLSRMEIDAWEKANRLSPSDFLVNVVLPELDGNIETYPIAALQHKGYDETYQIEIKDLELIEERADYLISRIKKWLVLQKKRTPQKELLLSGTITSWRRWPIRRFVFRYFFVHIGFTN